MICFKRLGPCEEEVGFIELSSVAIFRASFIGVICACGPTPLYSDPMNSCLFPKADCAKDQLKLFLRLYSKFPSISNSWFSTNLVVLLTSTGACFTMFFFIMILLSTLGSKFSLKVFSYSSFIMAMKVISKFLTHNSKIFSYFLIFLSNTVSLNNG